MWHTGVFVSEMLGTAFLVAGVIASITLGKKFKLTGLTALLFGAMLAGLSLWGAVAIGETSIVGGPGYGFVNPGVAFMHCVGTKNFNPFLPSIVGEFLGAGIVAVIYLGLAKLLPAKYYEEDLAHLRSAFEPETKVDFVKNSIGEVIGTTIFFGGVALVALNGFLGIGAGPMLVALTVGLSLFLGIIVSSSFGAVLNVAVGFALLVVRLAMNRGQGWKVSLANYANGFILNWTVAAVIGGLYIAA